VGPHKPKCVGPVWCGSHTNISWIHVGPTLTYCGSRIQVHTCVYHIFTRRKSLVVFVAEIRKSPKNCSQRNVIYPVEGGILYLLPGNGRRHTRHTGSYDCTVSRSKMLPNYIPNPTSLLNLLLTSTEISQPQAFWEGSYTMAFTLYIFFSNVNSTDRWHFPILAHTQLHLYLPVVWMFKLHLLPIETKSICRVTSVIQCVCYFGYE
jgi:hypothetical protein